MLARESAVVGGGVEGDGVWFFSAAAVAGVVVFVPVCGCLDGFIARCDGGVGEGLRGAAGEGEGCAGGGGRGGEGSDAGA